MSSRETWKPHLPCRGHREVADEDRRVGLWVTL